MIPEKTQAQALESLQSIIRTLKTPRARSVLQCAGMGALAFFVMILAYRYSSNQPLFGLTGSLIALVLGGIAGALVRHYFVKVEQEVAAGKEVPEDLQPDTAEPDVCSEPEVSAAEPVAPSDVQSEVAPVVDRAPEPPLVTTAVAPVLEPELVDTPKQLPMFPELPGVEEPQESVHQELAEEPVAPAQPQKPDEHDIIAPFERHYLSWVQKDAPVFCIALSPEDEILMINRYMTEALGYPWEELSGKGFTETLVPPIHRRDAWAQLVWSASESSESFGVRSFLWTKDGRQIPVQWQGTAIFDEADALTRCFLIGAKATESEQRDRELQEERNHYETLYASARDALARVRSILESSVDAMVVFDMQGKATYVNPAFTELYGWTAEDLQNRDSPFVPKDQRELEKPYLGALGDKGMPYRNLDTKRQCKDGTMVSTRMTASLVRNEQGEDIGVLFTLRGLVGRAKEVKEPTRPALQPEPQRQKQKRQVNAREIAGDITAGLTDAQLMEKYKLTAKGLHSLFEKLIQAKVIKASQIVRRSVAYDETVAIELNRVMPLDKVRPRPTVSEPPVPVTDVPPVSTDVQGLEKFGLTEDNLDDMVKDLFPGRGSEMATLSQDSLPGTEEVEDVTARRTMQRHYMVVAVPVCESNNLLTEGTIIDISEQGMKIQGIDSKKGDIKSLLVQGDQFHDVFPFVFDAECRWATRDEASGETLAGFQITAISQTSLQELRKLIAALSLSS